MPQNYLPCYIKGKVKGKAMAILRLEALGELKNSMTSSEI
jgi:hypothetical protein